MFYFLLEFQNTEEVDNYMSSTSDKKYMAKGRRQASSKSNFLGKFYNVEKWHKIN